MKQMNKEELIEYFIQQLGDNHVLSPIMSIEEIREKLYNMIGNITYNDEIGRSAASWTPNANGTGTLNFDSRKISDVLIVHELLHVLSTSSMTNEQTLQRVVKCGTRFHINSSKYDGTDSIYHTAINEGMTQALAEEIAGPEKNGGYDKEMDLYKILSVIVGKDAMMMQYFSECSYVYEKNNESILGIENSILADRLDERYGELGIDLLRDIRKISYLSDQSLEFIRLDAIHGLNDNGTRLLNQMMNKLRETIENLVIKVLNNEQDIDKKINEILVPLSKTSVGQMCADTVFEELINDESIDLDEKIRLLNDIRQSTNFVISNSMIEKLLQKIPPEDQLDTYISLRNNCELTEASEKVLYNIYVNAGVIDESKFSKCEMFQEAIWGTVTIPENSKEIDDAIKGTTYYKCGDYYILNSENRPRGFDVFDENGHRVYPDDLSWSPLSKKGIFSKLHDYDIEILSQLVEKDKVEALSGQIIDKCNNSEAYKQIDEEAHCISASVSVFDKCVILEKNIYSGKTKIGTFQEFYMVDENGNLVQMPRTENRRLTDDMSELDIQLQEQTCDVSMTEMIQEADNLKNELSKDTNENLRGDDSNGR